MSQLEDLNRAMAYIEEHLDGTVDMDVLARIAVCSKYQLQRMFPYLTGVTLPEYIRRRAMTRAAQDLRATDAKVVDVALRYGYDSPTAFARAFRRVHGAWRVAQRRSPSADQADALPALRVHLVRERRRANGLPHH